MSCLDSRHVPVEEVERRRREIFKNGIDNDPRLAGFREEIMDILRRSNDSVTYSNIQPAGEVETRLTRRSRTGELPMDSAVIPPGSFVTGIVDQEENARQMELPVQGLALPAVAPEQQEQNGYWNSELESSWLPGDYRETAEGVVVEAEAFYMPDFGTGSGDTNFDDLDFLPDEQGH
jgi:hypothetical protein